VVGELPGLAPRREVRISFEDLLLAVRLPVFTRRSKRAMAAHPKFYFFDAGVFRALRPRGPLDSPAELDGAALETLFLQEIRALNEYRRLDYNLYYWRSSSGLEVDLVLYGERGLRALEIKRTSRKIQVLPAEECLRRLPKIL
jgi:predicted AAA+ superfamily ATPase